MSVLKVGLIGFGLSGKVFHAPFLKESEFFSLDFCVTSQEEKLKSQFQHVTALGNVEELISKDIDLVVITSPNYLHFEHAKTCLEAKKHVVIEKPFVTNVEEAHALKEIAQKNNREIFIYHNRRWDGDFLTIKNLLKKEVLGKVHYFESRFDRFKNYETPKVGWRSNEDLDGHGVLYDLGPHLIDQAICLFGKPLSFWGKNRFYSSQSKVSEGFYIFLQYERLEVHLHASSQKLDHSLRFRLDGSLGSYSKHGLDPQEDFYRSGLVREDLNATLINQHREKIDIQNEKGNYQGFYNEVFSCLKKGKKFPISFEQSLCSLNIIESIENRKV